MSHYILGLCCNARHLWSFILVRTCGGCCGCEPLLLLRLRDGGCGDEGVREDARGAELGGDAAGDVTVLALHVSARIAKEGEN